MHLPPHLVRAFIEVNGLEPFRVMYYLDGALNILDGTYQSIQGDVVQMVVSSFNITDVVCLASSRAYVSAIPC